MNWLAVVASLGSPILIVIGGIVTWVIKSKAEELRAIEEKLRDKRAKVYTRILDPFIHLFADLKQKGPEKGPERAMKMIASYGYRSAAFELALVASDDVVRAYSDMVGHAHRAEASGKRDSRQMLEVWGKLLLEIRKSLGNKNTNLDELDMLRGMAPDVDQLQHQ